VLKIRSLSKTFAGPRRRAVLANIDFELNAGDYVAVMGESGVGKSTLLNLIAGLDQPGSGDVLLNGVALGALDDDALTRLRGEQMGFVFQAFHVLPYLSVAENVALPLALLDVRGAAQAARVGEMLDAVGLAGREASRPREVSGGELQRVTIARARVHRPALVLADEPTGNLDPDTGRRVIALLRDAVKSNGAAVVLATHSRSAAATGDRIYRLTAAGLQPASADDIE